MSVHVLVHPDSTHGGLWASCALTRQWLCVHQGILMPHTWLFACRLRINCAHWRMSQMHGSCRPCRIEAQGVLRGSAIGLRHCGTMREAARTSNRLHGCPWRESAPLPTQGNKLHSPCARHGSDSDDSINPLMTLPRNRGSSVSCCDFCVCRSGFGLSAAFEDWVQVTGLVLVFGQRWVRGSGAVDPGLRAFVFCMKLGA